MRLLRGMIVNRKGNLPELEAVGVDVVECLFLLIDSFLEAPNILVAIDFDRKYASRIFAEDPTIQLEQGQTNYCK